MKSNIRTNLLEGLKSKKVLIWGSRMTGIGALRKLKEQNINVINFIDSDKSLVGKIVHGLKVIHPKEIKNLSNINNNLVILIAVSIKENEILKQLEEMGITDIPTKSFFFEEAPYYTIDILGSCNLRCASCPHSIVDTDVPKGSMNLDKFKLVFDKILTESPMTSHISLYSWGEPLLHPYVNEIINYVHEKNVAVALSSNLSIKLKIE